MTTLIVLVVLAMVLATPLLAAMLVWALVRERSLRRQQREHVLGEQAGLR